MAELQVPHPEATWRKLRDLAGSRAALLPASFPMLVATLLDLSHTAAGSIDSDVPAVGAVIASGTEPAWVFGLHVKSGRELAAALTNGADASHAARLDATSGVLLLEPKARKSEDTTALGIVGNYLLVAPSPSPLVAAGPFVARTLPGRPQVAEPLVLSARQPALKGAIVKLLREAWRARAAELKAADRSNRERHGGRAPDFGDPLAALSGVDAAVDAAGAVLEGARELKLIVDPQEAQLELRAELAPEADGPAAELVRELEGADLGPLLELPRATAFGVLTRSTRAQRDTSAKNLRERLQALFGERITASDRALLEQTFADLARGRGDFAAYGVLDQNGAFAAMMRGAAGDAAAFDLGMKSLLKLPKLPAFAEPLRQFVGALAVRTSSVSVPGLDGKVERAALSLKPARVDLGGQAVQLEPQAFELLWRVEGPLVYAAVARNAAPALLQLVKPAGQTLAADPELYAAVKRAGTASFAAVLRPLVFVDAAPNLDRSAPVLLTLGRQANRGAVLRISVAKAVVDAAARGAFEP